MSTASTPAPPPEALRPAPAPAPQPFVRLADKIKHVEDHHLLELIRDTHKPAGSATPLIEPPHEQMAAVANLPTASSSSVEAAKPFPIATANAGFGAPLLVHPDSHHEQQQEDYLWGV